MPKTSEIISIIEKWMPKSLANPRDNIGLQIGSLSKEVAKILIALDIREEVIREAIEQRADLIISHHALIYSPLGELIEEDPISKLAMEIIRNNINVYVAHTNFDSVESGVNSYGAQLLELEDCQPLVTGSRGNLYKYVVYLPEENIDEITDVAIQAGAGLIGNYRGCSFRIQGQGTFIPSESANPVIGEKEKLNLVDEIRLEIDIHEDKLFELINKIKEVHPYEEVAYNIYPLKKMANCEGLGVIGNLKKPKKLNDLIKIVKNKFQINTVKIIKGKNDMISRIAFCGGSGGNLIELAFKEGAELFVSGDITYHQAMTARNLGLSLIDGGHNPTERLALRNLKKKIEELFINNGLKIEIIISEKDKDIWRFV